MSNDQESQRLIPSSGDNYSMPSYDNDSPVGKIVFLVFVVITLNSMFFVVEPGTIGVVVTLGKVASYPSGVYTKLPFVATEYTFTSKTQKLEETNQIPTKEGLNVQLDTAVLFRLEASKAADVYRQVGKDYVNILLAPEAAAAVRGLTSESEAKALYSSGRTLIQDSLKQELKTKLEPRGIIIEDVLLKDMKLPQQLTASIEAKVQAEQDAERMEFVLQKERQEAERKAIEAGGIASFQKIVSEGISPELLQWKGVEATEKFAVSPNTKIVIMGNGKEGLPVILSAEDDNSSA
jgi:prohibitin 1